MKTTPIVKPITEDHQEQIDQFGTDNLKVYGPYSKVAKECTAEYRGGCSNATLRIYGTYGCTLYDGWGEFCNAGDKSFMEEIVASVNGELALIKVIVKV